MVAQDGGGQRQRLVGTDAAVRPDLDHELFIVRAAADAGVVHGVLHAADGGKQRIDRDQADFLVGLLVPVGGAVAAADLDLDLGVEDAIAVQRADVLVGIEHLDGGIELDVGGGDVAGALDLDAQHFRLAGVHLQQDLLEVQDDVGDILDAALQVAEFVFGALDAHGGDGGAFQRGQQHAAQGIAEGAAVAGLEGLGGEHGVGRGGRFLVLDDEARHLEPVQAGTHGALLPVPGVGRDIWRGLFF